MPLILEGLVTTRDVDGAMHLAPMGPHVQPDLHRFLLRPFPSSKTCHNLRAHPEGVLHVTDDALLLAQAAIGEIPDPPPHRPAERVGGFILTEACRALEFVAATFDESEPRVRIECETVRAHSLRDFFGFNRARHAVVEAAILATRRHLVPIDDILAEYAKLAVLVEKTGGPREHEALALLLRYIEAGRGASP
ncbi:MAG: DUF447 domain-containing protein [Gemmataceae bacterium]